VSNRGIKQKVINKANDYRRVKAYGISIHADFRPIGYKLSGLLQAGGLGGLYSLSFWQIS
jgi:hypothetical protein